MCLRHFYCSRKKHDASSVMYNSSVLLFCRSMSVVVDCERMSMDMLKIEQVIVGSEVRSTSAEIKSEPVASPLVPCKIIHACGFISLLYNF